MSVVAISMVQRHVRPDKSEHGGWHVTSGDAEQVGAHTSTQAAAIQRAREDLQRAGGGTLFVHGVDDSVRETRFEGATMSIPERGELLRFLSHLTYPATKADIVHSLLRQGAPSPCVDRIRALPDETFVEADTVLLALPPIEK